MDFSLSSEQKMIQDSVSRFILNDYDFDTRRKILASIKVLNVRSLVKTRYISVHWLRRLSHEDA